MLNNDNFNFLDSITILYVEDEEDIRNELKEMLEFDIKNLYVAQNGQEGLKAFIKHKPEIIITDVKMPVMDGLKMAEEIKKINPEALIIITTAFSDTTYLLRAIDIGIDKYITKPVDYEKLIDSVTKLALNIYREKEVKLNNQFISFILDSNPSFVLTTKNNKIDYINKTFLNFLGFENIKDFLETKELSNVINQIDEKPHSIDDDWFKILTSNDEEHIVYFKIPYLEFYNRAYVCVHKYFKELDRYLFTFVDISKFENEKQKITQKAKKSEDENKQYLKILEIQSRQAILGEMIDSVAHQWKQPLSAINLYAMDIPFAIEDGAFDEAYGEEISNKIILQVTHMVNTLEEFRSFFRPNKQKNEFVLKELFNSVLLLVKDDFKKYNIDVDIECNENIKSFGFPNEFKHVILNIINNSKDAFNERGIKDKKIKIKVNEDEEHQIIEIVDNAGGIKEDVLPHIFKANFTTKAEGKGTGVGLYMSKMIIEDNMQGKIIANNTDMINNGVEFKIFLPKPIK